MAQEVNTGDTANAKNSDNEAAAGVSDDTTQTASEGDQAESTVSADDVQGDVSSDAQVSSDEPPPDELMQQGETVEREANRIIEQVKKRREEEVEREAAKAKEVQPGDIRVNHVPDVIKQEIKDELRGELRTGVLEDLISHAKTQRWGLPDA
ncbi:MAG: putative porin, partial [Gammaproteobacteria bacterium]